MVDQRSSTRVSEQFNRRTLLAAAGVSLGTLAAGTRVFAQAAKPAAAKPTVEPDVLAAWQKIRGELTWIGPWDHGALLWSARADELHDAVPGFYVNQVGNADLSKLPEASGPWGIYLGQAVLTPSQIKQLKAFKNLRYINLRVAPGNKTCPGLAARRCGGHWERQRV